MATITSAQSGNFNATSTWVGGVVPVDGDSFVIAAGHTVTYNVSTPVTNGFNDSTIYGILQSQANASTTLRMNGILAVRTNGTYHARAGHKLQFNGTNAENHFLYQYAESAASVIMEGSDGMTTTTITQTENDGNTSFTFSSTSGFAAEEWFSVYDYTTSQTGNAGSTTLRDEGFWIHEISGNTVYFRQFVGPTATITAASGVYLTVDNSKVFRVGQKLIFGTGANRNIRTISSIDYNSHILTLNTSITGSVVGLTVYETGTDKQHASGEKVRKVATVTTAASSSSSTTISVANADKFTAGDEIWIEARSECGGSTDTAYNAYSTYVKTVQSVSGTTITLTGTIGYNVVQGALVTRLTRDVIVEPVVVNSDYYGFYMNNYTSSYNRKLILKDVYFRYCGASQSQNNGGLYLHGYASTNSPAVTLTNTVPSWNQQPWMEGVTMSGSNLTRDWGGYWILGRYYQIRNAVVVGIFNSSIGQYYREGTTVYNSIGAGSNAWGFRIEGNAEWSETAYNYSSRNYRSFRLINYDSNMGIHHNIGDASTDYWIYSTYNNNIQFYKFKLTGGRYGLYQERPGGAFLYSTLAYASGYDRSGNPGTNQRGWYYVQNDRFGNSENIGTSLEHNMEVDQVRQYSYLTERYWDKEEGAWRVLFNVEAQDYGSGWFSHIYLPGGVTLRVSLSIKLPSDYSGNYPRLEARSAQSGVGVNQLGNNSGNWGSYIAGGNTSTDFTSAAIGAYEEKQLTVSAVNFPRVIIVGVHGNSTNMSEGLWMKPIKSYLDKAYYVPAMSYANSTAGTAGESNYEIKQSFTEQKIRLGGRIK